MDKYQDNMVSTSSAKMRLHWKPWLAERYYSHMWGPAITLATALGIMILGAIRNISNGAPALTILFLDASVTIGSAWRAFQFIYWLMGAYFEERIYDFVLCGTLFLGLVQFAILISYHLFSGHWISLSSCGRWTFWTDRPPGILLTVYVLLNTVLFITDFYLRKEFREYINDQMVLRGMDYIVSADSTSLKNTDIVPTLKCSRILDFFRSRSTGAIALAGDDRSLATGGGTTLSISAQRTPTPWEIPEELAENVLHWSRLAQDLRTHKALWVTVDIHERSSDIARALSGLLSSSSDDSGASLALVDLGQTRSAVWPLIRGFAVASPRYRVALASLDTHFSGWPGFGFRALLRRKQPDVFPFLYSVEKSDLIRGLICGPLISLYAHLTAVSGVPILEPSRIVLVVHGLQNKEQADEVYETIDLLEVKLKEHYKYVGIVVVSDPQLLRHVADADNAIMRYVCCLHVSDGGSIRYSGGNPTLPAFYEHLFLLLVDGLHRTGGVQAEGLWKQLPEVASISQELEVVDDEPSPLPSAIFVTLFGAAQVRKKILELLSELKVISRNQINKRLVKDNIKIAETLQRLFESKSYVEENIAAIPREHAFAVLNLTHYILDRGLPKSDKIKDARIFVGRAHCFLNWLATHLHQLPEEIAVHGVTLISDLPVGYGGFGNIYRGTFRDANGGQVDVALKVLQIFGHPSEEIRQVLQDRFTTEALVWHYLKHNNIVPFFGVDSTTFPYPTRAMVSPWMSGGSVLKYIAENSPSATSAIELICDVSQGLSYLHSANIVHGDLCGRNILMDDHPRARLTEFGLAAFIESDADTTRGGSTRWMAPELFPPLLGVLFRRTTASDVWAFGCVCCEIWSGGKWPFSDVESDLGVFIAISERRLPYQTRPSDTRGQSMPDGLWDLVQGCWNRAPDERPSAAVLVGVLTEMRRDL